MPFVRLTHLALRLPAHVINGLGVALGVGWIQALVAGSFGAGLALAASSGAVYGSLVDVPNAPHRTWRRVLTAALLGSAVSALVSWARPSPWLLGVGVALIGFLTALALAWGPRGGPLGFVAVLAFVFTMATPAAAQSSWHYFAAVAGGSFLYLGWAMVLSHALQPRYRSLALAAALEGMAKLLRDRSAVLVKGALPAAAQVAQLDRWLHHESALAERLQAARDLLYAAREGGVSEAQTRVLMGAIDLHDMLQASELDVGHLGADTAGLAARTRLAAALSGLADGLDGAARAARWRDEAALDTPQACQPAALPGLFAADDPRARLVTVMVDRVNDMRSCVARMQEAARAALRARAAGGPAAAGADRAIPELPLAPFTSVEGWPLAALRPHLRGRSPVMRHALRVGLAMGVAYALAALLPHAAHPYWLVLSVAVVLRGNLEQTLSRRNDRVLGTVLGCALAFVLTRWASSALLPLAFLVAVMFAHAFVNERYLVTALAGTVLALVQSHLAEPQAALAVGERVLDTVLGGVLAWGFSYVLPSWERRGVRRLAASVTESLAALAASILCWPSASTDLALRLNRRAAFDTLGNVALAAQRTRAEPRRVRLPLPALAEVLVQGQSLLAHLLAVRMLLAHRRDQLPRHETEAALQQAAAVVAQALSGPVTLGGLRADEDLAIPLPSRSASEALLPWLQRRLQLAALAAQRLADAVQALRSAAA